MGVTLERVQNKFACIIGELCSEPVILSQFAIWVDLRIAEYKAKGAISLECSGEEPDPIWLKGHNPLQSSVKRDLTPLRLHGRGMGDNSLDRQHGDTFSHSNIDQSEEAAARLSPDIVMIKEEPVEAGDGVFPVSLHRHDSSTSNRNTPRKRTSAETIGQSDPGSSTSQSKIRRLSSSSPALLVEPVNQSLMSIISEGALEESADNSANFSLDYSGLDPNTEDNSSSVFQSQPVPSTSSAESGDQQDNNSTALPSRARLSQKSSYPRRSSLLVNQARGLHVRKNSPQGIQFIRAQQKVPEVRQLERPVRTYDLSSLSNEARARIYGIASSVASVQPSTSTTSSAQPPVSTEPVHALEHRMGAQPNLGQLSEKLDGIFTFMRCLEDKVDSAIQPRPASLFTSTKTESIDSEEPSTVQVPDYPTTSMSSSTLPRYPEITTVQPMGRPQIIPTKRHLPKKNVKSRIANIGGKSSTTVGNLVGAVTKLENWLMTNHNDSRNIEDIPPVELDNYLVMFFSILKNRHGGDYDPESYSNFRSFLERFLKERGYPASLSSSSMFVNSQAIYNDKRKSLMKSVVEKRRAKHRQYFMNVQLAAAIARQNSLSEPNDEPQNLSMNNR